MKRMEVENVIKNLKHLISDDYTGNQYDYTEEIETAITSLEKNEPKNLCGIMKMNTNIVVLDAGLCFAVKKKI